MTAAMRCLACGYDLRGLPEPRCPECGRAFDPDDPTTFVVLKSVGKTLRFDAWIAVVLAAFGPGSLVVAWLTGSFPLGSFINVSMVAVSPHMLFGAALGALVVSRCVRILATGGADENSRRRLHVALWLAGLAAIVSAGFMVLAIVQIGRLYRFF